MHVVTRSYSGKGAKELFDVLEKHKSDVEKLIRGIDGFVSYSLVRTSDGGFSFPCFATRLARTKATARQENGSAPMPVAPARHSRQYSKARPSCI